MSNLTLTLSIILALFFTFASSIKLIGWQKVVFKKQLAFFIKYGLNRWIMGLVGVIELSASLFLISPLLFPQATFGLPAGAALILLTSLGAIFFHLRFDTMSDAIPAIITGGLSSLILFHVW